MPGAVALDNGISSAERDIICTMLGFIVKAISSSVLESMSPVRKSVKYTTPLIHFLHN